jgi:peptide deformylase
MPTRDILQLGNPLLWKKSSPVDDVGLDKIQPIITDLSDTLMAFRGTHGFGRGIAAPQIGNLKRIIYIKIQPPGLEGPLVNPEIVWADPEKIEVWDNCFSFPDLVVRVKRFAAVKVKYLDLNGTEQVLDASGDLSELLQHEIDHLDGILAVRRAISSTSFMTYEEWVRQGRPE